MRLNLRAAALAAAALALGAGAPYNPLAASQAVTTPAVSYAEHAVAVSPALDIGLNALPQTAQRAETAEVSPAVPSAEPAAPAGAQNTQTEEPAEEEREVRRSLSQLVSDHAASNVDDEQTDCLARAVYFESKGEPLAGQLTVAEVIINRAKSGRFARTVCGVIRQPSQFSFVRGGVIPNPPRNAHWRTAVAIARIAMQDLADGSAPRALFFHARHVSPRWRNVTRVATVGNHVFYR